MDKLGVSQSQAALQLTKKTSQGSQSPSLQVARTSPVPSSSFKLNPKLLTALNTQNLKLSLQESKIFQKLMQQGIEKNVRLALPDQLPMIKSGQIRLRIEQMPEIMSKSEARQKLTHLTTDMKQTVGEIFNGILKDSVDVDVYLAGAGAIHLRHPDSTREIQDLDFRADLGFGVKDFNTVEGHHIMAKTREGMIDISNMIGIFSNPGTRGEFLDKSLACQDILLNAPPKTKQKQLDTLLRADPKFGLNPTELLNVLKRCNPTLVKQIDKLVALQKTGADLLQQTPYQKIARSDEQSLIADCFTFNSGFQSHLNAGGNAKTMMHPGFLGVEVSLTINDSVHGDLTPIPGSQLKALGDRDLFRDKLKTTISRDKRDEKNIQKTAQDLLDALSLAPNVSEFKSELKFLRSEMQTRVEQYRLNNIESDKRVLNFRDDLLTLRMVDRFMRTIDTHVGKSAMVARQEKFDSLLNGIPDPSALDIAEDLQIDVGTDTRQLTHDIIQDLKSQFNVYQQVLATPHDERALTPQKIAREQILLDMVDQIQSGQDLDQWFDVWNKTLNKPPLQYDLEILPSPTEFALKDTPIDEILDSAKETFKGKILPKEEQVVWTLMNVGGFRPLGDTRNDLNTIRAFGLSSNQFSQAFTQLGKLGLVSRPSQDTDILQPKGDGLHFNPQKSIYDLLEKCPDNFANIRALLPPRSESQLVVRHD